MFVILWTIQWYFSTANKKNLSLFQKCLGCDKEVVTDYLPAQKSCIFICAFQQRCLSKIAKNFGCLTSHDKHFRTRSRAFNRLCVSFESTTQTKIDLFLEKNNHCEKSTNMLSDQQWIFVATIFLYLISFLHTLLDWNVFLHSWTLEINPFAGQDRFWKIISFDLPIILLLRKQSIQKFFQSNNAFHIKIIVLIKTHVYMYYKQNEFQIIGRMRLETL